MQRLVHGFVTLSESDYIVCTLKVTEFYFLATGNPARVP